MMLPSEYSTRTVLCIQLVKTTLYVTCDVRVVALLFGSRKQTRIHGNQFHFSLVEFF